MSSNGTFIVRSDDHDDDIDDIKIRKIFRDDKFHQSDYFHVRVKSPVTLDRNIFRANITYSSKCTKRRKKVYNLSAKILSQLAGVIIPRG